MSLHKEINFESEICQHLAANGWLYAEGDAANYNRTLALYPADVKTFREVCCGRLEIPAEAFDKKVLLASPQLLLVVWQVAVAFEPVLLQA